ncbi:MAG: formimidoylglutamate deiminase [Longimicrobiales bacterium]
MPTLLPDLVWLDGEFRRGLAVSYSATSGRITHVGPAAGGRGEASDEGPVLALYNRALVPGFVNAHSHAFQRLMRGRTQWRGGNEASADFWSWRTAMYETALHLSPEDVYEVSRFCFIEMLAAGITAVGEFHYLQRDPAGNAYADPAELALRVIAAAEDAGIRIRLLNVAYACGGINELLRAEQRRFATPDLDGFIGNTKALVRAVHGRPLATIGVAPHSVRAVERSWLAPLHELACECDAPFHMHVSEQPAEVAAALEAWGRRPVEMLADEGVLDERLTAVHATHLTHREVTALGNQRVIVCACPTTERDLGDGFLPGAELLAAGAGIAIGTDSQTMIEPLEEMRLLEYHERLRRLERVILAPAEANARNEVAPILLAAATETGARSLRIDAGRFAAGALADFLAIDLGHRALAGWQDETLAACLVLSAPVNVVSDVWVGGVQRIRGGHHRLDAESQTAFARVARRFAVRS